MQQSRQARKRAELILKVQSGQITASQAADELGVSRKTYYKWEKRGLQGLMESLQERGPGRPMAEEDPKTEALSQRVEELEQELRLRARSDELKARIKELKKKETPGQKSWSKKSKPSKNASR